MAHKDGPGVEIYPPGERLPTGGARGGPIGRPAEGNDFAWVRPSVVTRFREWRLTGAVNRYAAGLEIAAGYSRAAADYERSRQELAYAHEQAALVPLKIERDRQQFEAAIVEGRIAFDAMLQEHQQAAELAAADHKIELQLRKAQRLEAKARVKDAKRTVKDAGKKKRSGPEMPEEFRRHWHTEQRVRMNRSEAEERVAAIYGQARAERRNLSADELEEIDALSDAAEAAEADVRRRAAGGF